MMRTAMMTSRYAGVYGSCAGSRRQALAGRSVGRYSRLGGGGGLFRFTQNADLPADGEPDLLPLGASFVGFCIEFNENISAAAGAGCDKRRSRCSSHLDHDESGLSVCDVSALRVKQACNQFRSTNGRMNRWRDRANRGADLDNRISAAALDRRSSSRRTLLPTLRFSKGP